MPTNAQPEPADMATPHRPKSHGPLVVLLGMPLLLVGYVLSSGPAIHVLGWELWSNAYTPLIWLGQKYQPADAALWWYMEKCGAEFGVPPMAEPEPATQS